MGQVVAINQKKFFSLDDAIELLPIVRRVTQVAYDEVKKLSTQLAFTRDKMQRRDIERDIQGIFQRWNQKVGKLGCEAKGMWLVDFDNGEGYYCWHFPEQGINYFHGYFDGFRGRLKIN